MCLYCSLDVFQVKYSSSSTLVGAKFGHSIFKKVRSSALKKIECGQISIIIGNFFLFLGGRATIGLSGAFQRFKGFVFQFFLGEQSCRVFQESMPLICMISIVCSLFEHTTPIPYSRLKLLMGLMVFLFGGVPQAFPFFVQEGTVSSCTAFSM